MENEFVPYEIALALKELGFDEPCFGLYAPPCKTISLHHYGLLTAKEQILAPLYQQAFRWFREKYDLDKTIDNWIEQPMDGEIWDKAYQYYINGESYHPYFKTYEEAELECLKKLIEILKKNK